MKKTHSAQFLVNQGQLRPGLILLDDDESHHARNVRRARMGESVYLTDGFGEVGSGVITGLPRRGGVEIDVTQSWSVALPPVLITVVQAVAKNDRLETSLSMMTELGISRIIPWRAQRCVAGGNHVTDKWQKITREASKQSGRAWLPEVLAEHQTPQLLAELGLGSQVIVGEAGASETLGQVQINEVGSLVIVVGPEGGLTEPERDQFTMAGAALVSVGQNTLRSTTAGVALVSGLVTLLSRRPITPSFGG